MAEKPKQKNKAGWAVVHVTSIVACAAVFELFLILSLAFFKTEWKAAYYFTVLVGGSIANAALLCCDTVFYFLKKEALYKFCITGYVLALFFAIGFYILLRTGLMDVFQDPNSFKDFLEKSGSWMVMLFILLQFLQVVILPIPSTVTVVAGSMLFGAFLGSVYSLIGIMVGSLVAFFIGRYAGHRVAEWLVGKDTLEKWLKKIKGKDKLLLTAMFLLPVFPDDVLCIVAGISSMSLFYFITVIFISRVLAIFTTSYSIKIIPLNTWWGLLTWAILISLVIVIFIFLYKKSDSILGWFEKKFHRESRVKENANTGDFHIEVVDPNGNLYEKNIPEDRKNPQNNRKREKPKGSR